MNRQKENWLVIKSNRKIGRLLVSKLEQSTNLILFKELNTITICSNRIDLNSILSVLNQYQKQRFEVVRFTSEQRLLTVIKRGYCHDYIKRVQALPLSHKFMWYHDNKEGVQAVTPITQRQFNKIVKVN